MAKSLRLSQLMRENLLSGVSLLTLFDAGQLSIFPGTIPTDADAAEGATALADLTLQADAFGAFNTDRIPKLGTWSTSASVGGTAAWFRLYAKDQSGGTAILTGADTGFVSARIDGTVGITAGQFNLVLDSVILVVSQAITISQFDLVAVSPVTQ